MSKITTKRVDGLFLKDSEWKDTWVLDGEGDYEIVFERSDGKVFTAVFTYFDDLVHRPVNECAFRFGMIS